MVGVMDADTLHGTAVDCAPGKIILGCIPIFFSIPIFQVVIRVDFDLVFRQPLSIPRVLANPFITFLQDSHILPGFRESMPGDIPHHGAGVLAAGVGALRRDELLLVSLLVRGDGGAWEEGEVDPGVGHLVGLEFIQVLAEWSV